MTEFTMTSMPPIPRHIIIKHEGDAVEISNSTDGSNNNNKPTIPLNLPLVDEIDLQQCLVSPARPWQASAIQGVVIGKAQLEVICNATVSGGSTVPTNASSQPQASIACPCCRRYIQVNDSRVNIKSEDDAVEIQFPEQQNQLQHKVSEESNNNNESATLASRVQAAITSTLTMQPSLMQPMAAPPLASGDQLQDYTIKETIVQGWLYKKGTGADFSGRRWWKPRWITLALAETPNTSTPSPILISHRAPGVPYPASIIELTASTVIMAIERTNGDISASKISPSKEGANHHRETPSEEEWNRHCFQIVHTHHKDNETTPKTTTRIFTAPMQDRNEWVFAMNNALLGHEKRLSKARSDAAKNDLSMTNIMHQMTFKKARHFGLDGPIFCGEVMAHGREDLPQKQQQQQQTPWTNNNSRGNGRMRSLSPVVGTNASMGLPPTNPRRMRSPSPNRRPLDEVSQIISP